MSNSVLNLDALAPKFNELSQSHKSVVFARECLFAKQLLNNNDYLSKVAMQNPASLEAAILNIASIGLSLNPALKQAYLVPMDGKVNLQPSYLGLCHLAQETGSVRYVQGEIVFEKDEFEFQGVGLRPIHKFKPFSIDRGAIIGAYCVAKTSDNDYLVTMMPVEDIYKIRDRSSAWRAWISKKNSCPWVTDEKDMILKTVVRKGSKFWPKSERTYRLDEAIHIANDVDGIDFEQEKTLKTEGPTTEELRQKEKDKTEKISEIKAMLTVLSSDMDVAQKGKLMVSTCGISKFDQLSLKSLDDLDLILKKLLSMPGKKQKDQKHSFMITE